jgi:hypothetical protein
MVKQTANISLILALFLLLATYVSAETVYREFNQSSPTQTIYLYDFPYWIATNVTGNLYITNPDLSITNFAELTLDGTNYTNMTFVQNQNAFLSYVISNVSENVTFNILIKNSSGALLANATDILRFRIPYTLTFDFFKNENATNTGVVAYKNEFQYALLQYHDPYHNTSTFTLDAASGTAFTNSIFNFFSTIIPGFQPVKAKFTPRVTNDIFLFARVNNGVATINAYDNGTYDLFTFDAPIYGATLTYYEFGRPMSDGENQWKTAIAGNFDVLTNVNQGFSVFISAWEVYKWGLLKNILKIVFVLILWAAAIVALSFLLTCWLADKEMARSAFGMLLLVFCVVSIPILILAVKVIWS